MADLTQDRSGRGLPLLSDYSDFVRRHRILIALLTGTGLLVGLAWATTAADVLLGHRVGRAGPGPGLRDPRDVGLLAARGQHRHRRPAAPEPPRPHGGLGRARHGPRPGPRAALGHRLAQQPRAARDRVGRLPTRGGQRRRRRGCGVRRRPPSCARRAREPSAAPAPSLRHRTGGAAGPRAEQTARDRRAGRAVRPDSRAPRRPGGARARPAASPRAWCGTRCWPRAPTTPTRRCRSPRARWSACSAACSWAPAATVSDDLDHQSSTPERVDERHVA